MNKILNDKIKQHVKLSLTEDQVRQDSSTKNIDKGNINADIKFREKSIMFGKLWFEQSFRIIDPKIKFKWYFKDGDLVKKNSLVCTISGDRRCILSCERVALNFLQTLSAVSNSAYQLIKKANKKNIQILYTRKTIPGWRYAIDLACRKHGCLPHRKNLKESILIKENHLKCIDNFSQFIHECRKLNKKIIVEANSIAQLKGILQESGIHRVLLDNFTPNEVRKALRITSKTKIELSGNININNIHNYLIPGVDYISVGSITKNITATDMTLLVK